MENILGFHNPNEVNGYMSNWYISPFKKDGVVYTSMEQYMMYQKAKLFENMDIAKEILSTDDVQKIKALGRAVQNYNDTVWNGLRQIIVFEGLIEKFKQNEDLRTRLLSTGNAILAEYAVHDRIWGIGLSMNDPKYLDMKNWRGQNLLGFSLMRVRSILKVEKSK
ncbi:MAG: NADAR family protein [Acutalibacteraceae bacterium]